MKAYEICIAGRKIGSKYPTFIVAEMSANHLQNLDIALKTVHAAAECGAEAIKLQTYTPDTITLNSRKDCFLIRQNTIWDGCYLYDLYRQAYTPWEWHEQIFTEARNLGLIGFSSVFDPHSVDFLEQLGSPAYKIASFEINDLPLIQYAASKGKPILISTGIALLEEISEALSCCHAQGNPQVALLKCTSAYPAPLESIHLRTLTNMTDTFGVPVGISDHTLGSSIAIASVALGACIVEKHIILDKGLGGPDAAFSVEPQEFRVMVQGIRDTEKALGEVTYELTSKQRDSRAHARSLFAVSDIAAGEALTAQNIRSIRPAGGLLPKYYSIVLGKHARLAISRGTPLQWDMIDFS